ncbi:hypothetical protein [Actinoallomurus soli]|uniref:hypothetical protein n=1 Tax=Actinoallomurus soli TaxID=2952535 RepID=UPI002093099B|nr:hypothetical protein [Actinoallomurus soli]MCO5969417.1 hypothetical protein [Actinoallomurus soli]
MTSLEERVADDPGPVVADGEAPGRLSRGLAFARRHRVILAVLAPAVALRLVTMLGYRGAMWFPDSYDYVSGALTLTPNLIRPSGYSLFLWLLSPFHSLTLVVLVQHAMGVAVGVLVYALLRHRFGLPGWAASVAAVPALFDAFGVQLEHLIMSDTLFTFLLTLAVTLALWDKAPSTRRLAVVCLLVGLATVTRSVGLPILVLTLAWLAVRRAGRRAIAAGLVAGLLPVVLYAGWFSSRTHRFALTYSTGIFLYSRTMSFADCRKIKPPVEELPLCISTPPAERERSQFYIWGRISPFHRLGERKFTPDVEGRAGDFAQRAIMAQPGDYAETVTSDLLRTFRWHHPPFPDPDTYDYYLFQAHPPQPSATAAARMRAYAPGHLNTHVVRPYASIMQVYQRFFFVRGAMFGVILLAGLVALVRRRWAALLPWAVAVAAIVVPPTTAEFDYRYVIPALPVACVAAALAFRRDPALTAE